VNWGRDTDRLVIRHRVRLVLTRRASRGHGAKVCPLGGRHRPRQRGQQATARPAPVPPVATRRRNAGITGCIFGCGATHGPWRRARLRRLDRRSGGPEYGTERCSSNLRLVRSSSGSGGRGTRIVLDLDATPAERAPSAGNAASVAASVEGPWRGTKPREDRPSTAGIRRAMVRTLPRRKALKARSHGGARGADELETVRSRGAKVGARQTPGGQRPW